VNVTLVADGGELSVAEQVSALADSLSDRGAEVHVHLVDAGPPPMAEAHRLAEVLERERTDVVHSHTEAAAAAALAVGGHHRVPVVHTFHSAGGPSAAAIVGAASTVIATSRDAAKALLPRLSEPERLAVLRCGVDLDAFTPDGPRCPRDSDRVRLVMTGDLGRESGSWEVVRALVELPDVELVVAGGPPTAQLGVDRDAQRLRSFASGLGTGDRLRLMGRLTAVKRAALLRSADVAVTVPHRDSCGTAALEAMACGVPVVASAVGALPETVLQGVTGMLVPPEDPARLVAAVRGLLAERGLRTSLGRAGTTRATSFGWTQTGDQYLRLYERAIGAGLPGANAG
jgi:glycosyltransferase involved in cell wall biosynthesis